MKVSAWTEVLNVLLTLNIGSRVTGLPLTHYDQTLVRFPLKHNIKRNAAIDHFTPSTHFFGSPFSHTQKQRPQVLSPIYLSQGRQKIPNQFKKSQIPTRTNNPFENLQILTNAGHPPHTIDKTSNPISTSSESIFPSVSIYVPEYLKLSSIKNPTVDFRTFFKAVFNSVNSPKLPEKKLPPNSLSHTSIKIPTRYGISNKIPPNVQLGIRLKPTFKTPFASKESISTKNGFQRPVDRTNEDLSYIVVILPVLNSPRKTSHNVNGYKGSENIEAVDTDLKLIQNLLRKALEVSLSDSIPKKAIILGDPLTLSDSGVNVNKNSRHLDSRDFLIFKRNVKPSHLISTDNEIAYNEPDVSYTSLAGETRNLTENVSENRSISNGQTYSDQNIAQSVSESLTNDVSSSKNLENNSDPEANVTEDSIQNFTNLTKVDNFPATEMTESIKLSSAGESDTQHETEEQTDNDETLFSDKKWSCQLLSLENEVSSVENCSGELKDQLSKLLNKHSSSSGNDSTNAQLIINYNVSNNTSEIPLHLNNLSDSFENTSVERSFHKYTLNSKVQNSKLQNHATKPAHSNSSVLNLGNIFSVPKAATNQSVLLMEDASTAGYESDNIQLISKYNISDYISVNSSLISNPSDITEHNPVETNTDKPWNLGLNIQNSRLLMNETIQSGFNSSAVNSNEKLQDIFVKISDASKESRDFPIFKTTNTENSMDDKEKLMNSSVSKRESSASSFFDMEDIKVNNLLDGPKPKDNIKSWLSDNSESSSSDILLIEHPKYNSEESNVRNRGENFQIIDREVLKPIHDDWSWRNSKFQNQNRGRYLRQSSFTVPIENRAFSSQQNSYRIVTKNHYPHQQINNRYPLSRVSERWIW